jgi:NAD(P)-dependent dehydrogenase (short-subunit alcohol dehydrogenase family)
LEIAMPSILITGANRGLGLEFATQYAAQGWRIYATCRNPTAAVELTKLAAGQPELITVLPMDVADLGSVTAAARLLDGQPIDILLNNAGVTSRTGNTASGMDYASWARLLDINCMGPMRVTSAFVENVARSARRLVLAVSSRMGSIADNQSGGSIAYRSSKAAVNMVMRSLAVELAPRGISCVMLSPGWVSTAKGGAGASLTPPASVSALRKVIESLGPPQSGKFLHYDGSELPW